MMKLDYRIQFFIAVLVIGIAFPLFQKLSRTRVSTVTPVVQVAEPSNASCCSEAITDFDSTGATCCESQPACCSKSGNSNTTCCQTTEPALANRKSADEFMLMMQGMAGIGPEDSRWVSQKLFDGFLPSPMPCCGEPGSKSADEEHMCCENQVNAIQASERKLDFSQRARTRFESQFGVMLGHDAAPAEKQFVSREESGSGDTSPAPSSSGSNEKFAGLRIKIQDVDSVEPDLRVSAISTPIIYNRFGDDFRREDSLPADPTQSGKSVGSRDPNGMIFALDDEIELIRAGANYFNAGHDPMFYGVGRGNTLFMKDPRSGRHLDRNGNFTSDPNEFVPVRTVEPLVIRANCGDTLVIDFTNRLSVNGDCANDEVANLLIEGATYETQVNSKDEAEFIVGQEAVKPNGQIRYVIQVGEDPGSQGTYYFHSKPIEPGDIPGSLARMRRQTSHGLFGALIIEPKGSRYLDSYKFDIRPQSRDGFGNYEVDESSYVPVKSGWAAIIANDDPGKPAFREHVIFFHDELNDVIKGGLTGAPRALSYRHAGFEEIFGVRTGLSPKQPFAINDRSMAYSAYTYGDASTPHPQFYVGDPMRYRIVHSGAGNEFHVFHHHAHRWRFQPGIEETGAKDNTANLSSPSKRGRPEAMEQPDLTVPVSARIDSQTLGPGETFDVAMEGGAGGVQRTVGDSLLHCHIIEHVTQGMWTYARVYNTLQEPGRSHYPSLAPLPDRLTGDHAPPIAVDSLALAELVNSPGLNKPKPVSGPLAGVAITDVEKQLHPYIENQLPRQGLPTLDTWADDADSTKTNRADQWDWETVDVPGRGRLYLGERYDLGSFMTEDTSDSKGSYVKFGVGYPTAGEGIGAHRGEPNPFGEDKPPLDRPRLLFNPKDGRLAYPHLLPHAGRRPPFAPKTSLAKEGDKLVLRDDVWKQGSTYLNKTISPTDPDSPLGTVNGSGLAPADAPIRRYNLVALPLKINYATRMGRPFAETVKFEKEGFDQGPTEQREFVISNSLSGNEWILLEPNGEEKATTNLEVRVGDRVKWVYRVPNSPMQHGLNFKGWESQGLEQFFTNIDSEAEFDKVRGRTNELPSEGTKTLFEATIANPNGVPFPSIAYQCPVHPSEMNGTVSSNAAPPYVDPKGQIFVLEDDVPDIVSGRKPAEPIVIRANVGEVVEVSLRSALTDDPNENRSYSKVGIHTHLVQYDVQSSDGAVGGLNYETSIRPSLAINGTQLDEISLGVEHEEVVRYRWWCDVELGTVYFHDHSLLKDSLPHGLFGATVVEPAKSQYLDPVSGKPLYVETQSADDPTVTVVSASNGTIDVGGDGSWGRGVSVASIHTPAGSARPSFREFVPLFHDSKGRADSVSHSINLRTSAERYQQIESSRMPWSDLKVAYKQGSPVLLGGKATLFSSHLNGDPVTPIWRSFPNDPARIRVEGGATNFLHSLTAHNHRWRFEQDNPNSALRDVSIAGVSEGFTFAPTSSSSPGDYLYGSTGSDDLLKRGKWGIWRIHNPADTRNLETASGAAKVFFSWTEPMDYLVRGKGNRWELVNPNGSAVDLSVNGKPVCLKPGDTIEWNSGDVSAGGHGVVFKDKTQAQFDAVFEVLDGGNSLKSNPGGHAGWGTDGVNTPDTHILTVRVKEETVANDLLPFFCTVHGEEMDGNVGIEADLIPFRIEKGTELHSRSGMVYTVSEDSLVIDRPWLETRNDVVLKVEAKLPGDLGNQPVGKRLGFHEKMLGDGCHVEVDRVVSLGIIGGHTPIQPIPGNMPPASGVVSPKTHTSVGLGAASDADAPHDFFVAALEVPLPIPFGRANSKANVPILAYVPIRSLENQQTAERIVTLARQGKAGQTRELESLTNELQATLRQQFVARPQPLVLRVAAPIAGRPAKRLGVRLINLLPTAKQLAVPVRAGESPFGLPYSPLTSLHASLVKSDSSNDGSAVGLNKHSLVAPGDARTYVWNIDQELGICHMRDGADPHHVVSGLFGALIVEPPGTRFLSGEDGTISGGTVGMHAIVIDKKKRTSFREYVLFHQDDFFAQESGFAINYASAGNTPHLFAHVGDSVRVRQVHAAGSGAQSGNHTFFIGGRRWQIDNTDARSNRIAAITQVPGSAVNAQFAIDDVFGPHPDGIPLLKRTYLYGSHVGDQLDGGEWGKFTVLERNDTSMSLIHPLPALQSKQEVQ